MAEINYWLMKSEPGTYSIEDLKKENSTLWDGIRNYQARNFMRTMNIEDQAFFYHSNCKPPGIVGLMKVVETGLIDPTQFDPQSKYFDKNSNKDNPRWDCARFSFLGQFNKMLSLELLRGIYNEEQLPVIKRGNRLSILPVPITTAKDLLFRLGPLI